MGLFARGNFDVVDVDSLLSLWREGVDSRSTVRVEFFDGNLDGPIGGFVFASGPGLGADFTSAVTIVFNVGLEVIPLVGFDWKFDRLLDAFVVTGNFEDVFVSNEADLVTLVDEADLRLDASVSVGHDVGFNNVVGHVFAAEEIHRPLEKNIIEAIGDDLGAVLFKDIPFDARTEPGDGWEVHFYAV